MVAAARAGLAPRALRAQEAAMEAWRRDPLPAGGAAPPTLVFHGDRDEVTPVANAALLAARWPGAEVEIVAGGGHAVMAQEPRRIAASIADLAGG